MADSYNPIVDQGSTFAFTINYKDPNGVGIDLSGHTIKMDVREGYKDSTLMFSLTNGSGIDMTSAATGVLIVTMSVAQTELLVDEVYRYDIEATLSGITTRLLQGEITSSRQVTD